MITRSFQKETMDQAVQALKQGEVVAFPTETVYGLGADATNESAVEKIYGAKNRPADNPLIVHISSLHMLDRFIEKVPNQARKLMEKFWPGPLTLILPVEPGVFSETVTAGLNTVGVRMPDHALALDLIEKVNAPLAAPSANLSGQPSPTTASHVHQDLDGRIYGVLDGGETGVGLESTVLDLSDPTRPLIFRPGGVSLEELEAVIGGRVYLDQALTDDSLRPKSPGMKYTHYAPKEPVWIVENNWQRATEKMLNNGEKIGILADDEVLAKWSKEAAATYSLGSAGDVKSASHRLYAGLRYFEHTDATVILAQTLAKEGIGLAYMNRLEKASGQKRI